MQYKFQPIFDPSGFGVDIKVAAYIITEREIASNAIITLLYYST